MNILQVPLAALSEIDWEVTGRIWETWYTVNVEFQVRDNSDGSIRIAVDLEVWVLDIAEG